MKRLFLLLLVVFAGLAGAQDTTCNAGDVAWVKETVNANVGLGGACATTVAGAEYNSFAAPFGIQGVFDCACAGLEIRILTGTNNYGALSASWNNRDAANKQINVDTADGTVGAYITVRGYTDETTPATAARTTLQFESAAIAGLDGFLVTRFRYIFRDLRVTDTDQDGIEIGAAVTGLTYFINVESDNNARHGFVSTGNGAQVFFRSLAHDNTQDGFFLSTNDEAIGNEAHSNGRFGFNLTSAQNTLIGNLAYSNTSSGFEVASGETNILISNTAFGNAEGINVLQGAGDLVVDNIVSGNTTNGLDAATAGMVALIQNNNYSGNGTNRNVAASLVAFDDDAAAPDTTALGFVSPDFQPAAGLVDFTRTLPGGTTESADTKGAAHSAAGAGGNCDVAF